MSFFYGKVFKTEDGWFFDDSNKYVMKGKYAPQLTRLANSVELDLWIYKMPKAALHALLAQADYGVIAKGYAVGALAFNLHGRMTIYAAPPTTALKAFVAVHELFHIKLGHVDRPSRSKEEYEVESLALKFCADHEIPVTAQTYHDIKVNLNGYIRADKQAGYTPYPKAVELRDWVRSKISYRRPKGK